MYTVQQKQASNINANANYYFQTIKNTGMVKNAKEGFEKVLADEDGTFAFIHEASQVFSLSMHGSGGQYLICNAYQIRAPSEIIH